MNLIVNRKLDGAQKQVIYELTLKKRQSKKSTMSDKHREAKQQLAKELMLERKIAPSLGSVSSQNTIDSLITSTTDQSYNNCNHDQSSLNELHSSTGSNDSDVCNTSCSFCSISTSHQITKSNTITPPTTAASTTTTPPYTTDSNTGNIELNGSISCGCSFTRSDSSYSGSSTSEDISKAKRPTHQMIESDLFREAHLKARKKEASIKYNKIKLDQLNSELDRRLHQYEYLVAQEKALLGTYNLMLFTNQGVNNFHLHNNI